MENFKEKLAKYRIDFNAEYVCELRNQRPVKKEAKTFGKWVVDIDGGMDYNERYYLEPKQVLEGDMILHLFEKSWIDWNEFMPALLQSAFNQGIKKTLILTK